MGPAGIGIKEADGTIKFMVVADFGWIKDGIGDVLSRNFTTRAKAQRLIQNGPLPDGFLPLRGTWPAEACNETDFLRKLVCLPRCMISYAYLWKNAGWTFRRIDGSGCMSLEEAIRQGIED